MNFSLIVKDIGKAINRNSPTILTGMGVAGLVGTVALAVRGTVKAYSALAQEANFRADEYSEQTGEHQSSYPGDFTTQEIVEITWRYYVPTAVSGAFTIACMIGSNHISSRRNAALVSLFTLTEKALREYEQKVVETIGEKKEALIQGELAQDKLNADPIENKTVIVTGQGDFPCYDVFSGRYFFSNIEFLRKKENEFNQRLLRELWLPINDFFYEIGLDQIDMGQEMGWIAERELMELKFSTKLTTDGKPCLVMDYRVSPYHI